MQWCVLGDFSKLEERVTSREEFSNSAGTSKLVRVLLVDDYERWHDFVSTMLQRALTLQVVGHAYDGFEAIGAAKELLPDLILLDIGLPKLNGIEVARRIRADSPHSKILFISQELSAEVARQALATGARGYVVKTDAARELLQAVEAVLRGERFVSSRLAGNDLIGAAGTWTREGVSRIPPSRSGHSPQVSRHEVLFYFEEEQLLDRLAEFVSAALRARNSAFVLTTESRRDRLLLKLQALGVNMEDAMGEGRYISADAAETVSSFMHEGLPDPARVLQGFSDLIVQGQNAAKGNSPRVRAYGECSPVLWAQRKPEAAIQVEHIANQLIEVYDVDILCAYPRASFRREADGNIFRQICAEHTAVDNGTF
jgi:DNA-binding NarL/FixJ family response regulator